MSHNFIVQSSYSENLRFNQQATLLQDGIQPGITLLDISIFNPKKSDLQSEFQDRHMVPLKDVRDFSGIKLAQSIIRCGGNVGIVAHQGEQSESMQSTYKEACKFIVKHNGRARFIFTRGDPEYTNRWLRDSTKFIGINQSGNPVQVALAGMVACNLQNKDNAVIFDILDKQQRWLEELFNPLPKIQLNLFGVGGEFVPVGSDTVILTTSTRLKQSHLSDRELTKEFSKINRPKVIVIPKLFHDHADYSVAPVGDTIFIPEPLPQDRQLWVEHCPENLNVIKSTRSILEAGGLEVRGLPLPVPATSGSTSGLCNPINLIQVRSANNGLGIIVPSPPEKLWKRIGRSGDLLTAVDWLDGERHATYKRVITRELKKVGATKVEYVPASDLFGGLFHCATREIADQLIPFINKNSVR